MADMTTPGEHLGAATPPELPAADVVALLRERLYGAISCLATLAVLARYTDERTTGWVRVVDIAVAAGGLWAASLLAELIAHIGAEGHPPRGTAAVTILRSSSQILEASVAPAIILGAAAVGWVPTTTAMWGAMWFLVGELALITWLAVRRTGLPLWQRVLATLTLAAIGAAVVAVKMLSH